MPYAFDFVDEGVRRWTLTDEGATADLDRSYRPTSYVSAPDEEALGSLRGFVRDLPAVERASVERWRTGWRRDSEAVLGLRVSDVDSVRDVAATIRGWGTPGEYRPFDVDLSPGFRYCLDTGTDPIPSRPLATLRIAVPERYLTTGPGESVSATVGDEEDGETVCGEASEVAEAVAARVAEADPDVLVLNTAEVVPWLFAVSRDPDLAIGRRAGYRKLAGRSTYTSYGRVGHSPARYSIPGRVIVDESNAFLWNETGPAGCLDLVERSGKPLSKLAWASIGNALTAIQSGWPANGACSFPGAPGVTSSSRRRGRPAPPTAAASPSRPRSGSTRASTSSTSPRSTRGSSSRGTSVPRQSGVTAVPAGTSRDWGTPSARTGATCPTCSNP